MSAFAAGITIGQDERLTFDEALDKMLPDPLSHITPEAVGEKLQGFSLELQIGRDLEWLAMAIQHALSRTIPSDNDNLFRKDNKDIRSELDNASKIVSAARAAISRPSPAADQRLWNFSWQHSCLEGREIGSGVVMGEPSDYLRFKRALAELEWLDSFLKRGAEETVVPAGRPKTNPTRILRGRYLAPIFEAAYGRKVTANNWGTGDDRHKSMTPFMDFYKRVMSLSFDEHENSNLSQVTKAVSKLHRQQPVEFGQDVIPRL